MRRIGSGSRAIWCSRPARVRRTSPARSSTFTCFETALNDMLKGSARSVTRAAPFASRWTISRRVGSESAAKARSRTGGLIYSTGGLNIAIGPPLSSDRRSPYLWGQGRPRSPEESAAWLEATLESYEQLALGYLAVLRKEDGALIGRCGLMDLVVESAPPEHGMRSRLRARRSAAVVRDLAISPQNARSRRVAERFGVRAAGQMEAVGLTWDRYVWPLATGGAVALEARSRRTQPSEPIPGSNLGKRKGLAASASANPLVVNGCGGALWTWRIRARRRRDRVQFPR